MREDWRRRRKTVQLRPPKADEGEILTGLCMRSKASHGYDEAFMEACRGELTVEPTQPGIIVADLDDRPVGIAQIAIRGGEGTLEKLFVEPACHGMRIGRALLDWAKEHAARSGAQSIVLDADPGAAGFYAKMDAILCGSSHSGSIPGRMLPRFRIHLQPDLMP